MPKYSGTRARRLKRGHVIVIVATLVASALAGGAAIATTNDGQANGRDRLAGKHVGHPPARPASTPTQCATPSPTPTAKPTPTASPTPSESPSASPTKTPSPTSSPTESPSRTPTAEPTAEPPTTEPERPETGDFPNEDTTGVPPGTDLKPSGSITVTEDGAVLDALEIKGNVKIEADNVTIRRSRIVSTGLYAVELESGHKNLVIEDTEIDGAGRSKIAVLHGEYTLRRVNIHDFFDGVRIEGDNVLIEDSYIHHLYRLEGGHHDTIQMRQGTNVVIRNNNIQPYNPETDDPMNAAIQFGSLLGPIDDVLVEGNFMNGGNYTINAGKLEGGSVVFRDNRFGRDARYGIVSSGPGLVWEKSNVFDDTGEPAS